MLSEMSYLTALRDQLNLYGSFSVSAAQSGGGPDDDTESEPEDYHTNYESVGLNQKDILMKSTNSDLLKNKSEYYDIAISTAPTPLDQNILLNTIIENDLKKIAEMLLGSMYSNFESTPGQFTSCVVPICKNNQDKIQVLAEDLEKYASIMNKEGLKCLRNCRLTLGAFNTQTQKKNIDDCQNMINNTFITYVWRQYNTKNKEE
jgi:hypothetical protein